MGYRVTLKIQRLDKGTFDLSFPSEKMRPLGGLPSGVPFVLSYSLGQRMDGNGPDERKMTIRPYYRKFKAGEMTIFAVEVPNASN